MLTDLEKNAIRDHYQNIGKNLPGFRPRASQREMIAAIANAFSRTLTREEGGEPPKKKEEWKNYEDNQVIKPDEVSLTSIQMRLCHQAYKALKFDNNTRRNMCEYWSKFEDAFLDSCYKELSGMWHAFVLTGMVLEAHPNNKGANAGRHRSINLGTVGKPVRITPANLPTELLNLRQVLVHRSRWENRRYLCPCRMG